MDKNMKAIPTVIGAFGTTPFSMSTLFSYQNISISSYSFYQKVLIQSIQFSTRIDFDYTQLNVKTVLY